MSFTRHQIRLRRRFDDRPVQQTEGGRRLEHVAQRDGTTDRLLPAADQPGREQRMPTEVEETLVRVDLVQAQRLREATAGGLLPWRGGSSSGFSTDGAGRARTSSLPLTVRGSASRITTAEGTMYAGSCRATRRLIPAPSTSPTT